MKWVCLKLRNTRFFENNILSIMYCTMLFTESRLLSILACYPYSLKHVLEKTSWRIQSLKTQNIKQGFAARPLETRRTRLGQESGSVDQHDLDRRLGQIANRGPFGVEFGNRLSQ